MFMVPDQTSSAVSVPDVVAASVGGVPRKAESTNANPANQAQILSRFMFLPHVEPGSD